MHPVRTVVHAAAIACFAQSVCAEPPRYTAIDITDWSPVQLETLPFFKRLTPNAPADAPFGFVPVAASQAGHVAGFVDQSTPYTGGEAVLLRADANGNHTREYIDPFGTYSWGYWTCDSQDCHYSFGYIRDSMPSDMNWSGKVVGRATMTGSGEYAYQAEYHAFTYDADHGRVDLFPGGGASSTACINNRGETAGTLAGYGAYRRAPDGSMVALDPAAGYTPSPRWINANGVIIGSHYPSRAFASPGGASSFDLPDLGGFDTVSVSDLNDSGWIVGKSGNFGDAETFATIWQPETEGAWTEFDLVEQLDTPDVLLENAIAIDNAGNIIARGHEDGNDLFSSRTYWLMPNELLPGWCTPDIGLHPQDVIATGSQAIFSIAVVNEVDVTAYQWRRDGVDIDPISNPSAATPTLELSGLTNSDSGALFDCIVFSACGSTHSDAGSVQVEIGCLADLSGDGELNFFDVSAFLAAYQDADPAADFNGDGLFNFFDVSAFLAAYNAGCP